MDFAYFPLRFKSVSVNSMRVIKYHIIVHQSVTARKTTLEYHRIARPYPYDKICWHCW